MNDVHADLREEAGRWSDEHAETRPPPAPETPPAAAAPSDKTPASSPPPSDKTPGSASGAASTPSSSSSSEKAPPTLSAAASKARHDTAEKFAALGWGIIDIFVPKRLGRRMKLEPDEKAELIRLTVPVIEKRLPMEEGEGLSDEELLLLGALAIYGPKYDSPEPGPKQQEAPAGGPASKAEAPETHTTTSATVDGKPVEAQVLA